MILLNESDRFKKRNIGDVKRRARNARYRHSKWYKENREYRLKEVREWQKANRDRCNLNNKRYRRWITYKSSELLERARDRFYDRIAFIWAEKATMARIRYQMKEAEARLASAPSSMLA